MPGSVGEIKHKNSDIIPTTFKKLVATVEGKSEKEWLIENGFLASAEAIKAGREKRLAEEKAAKAAAEKAALLETLKNVEKHDESVLTERYKAILKRTLEKLEEFYPEHKTYAMDSLCSKVRENAVILSKDLGYNSVTEFLYAYGYEPISGAEVYELRKNCGYTPGNEPAIIKTRLDNVISNLNEYYPNRIIEEAIQKSHKSLADTIAGLWQWLGYEDSTAFLAAYGFTYTAKAGGQVRVDPAAIIDELKRRYPEGTDMSVQQITADNKDLFIKTLNNTAHQLFGMKLSDYLYEQGILINPPRGYVGNKRPEKLTSVQTEVTESVAEEKIESTTEISVIPETKTETQVTEAVDVAESHADKDDETILKEYTELLTSRIGTYPKKNISFEDLKFFNSDISFGALNRITIKLYGEKAIRYCQRMGFLDDISVESAVNNAKNTEDKIDEVEETKATDEATAAALKEKTEEKITGTNFNIKNGILMKYSGNAEEVTVPDGVVEIAGKAFARNEFIKRIIAPESLRRIDNSAFADCTALEEVRVTDKVEYIGKEVFKGCSALKGFVIPGNVTAIFERTFDGCKAMEYLVVHEHVSYVDTFNWLFSPVYGAINDKVKHNLCRTDDKYKNGQLPHGIAMPVCTLTAEDFRSREFLMCGNELVEYSGKDETVIIPDGVKTIGSFAFSMLYGEDCLIKRILIPDSVSAIKRGAFDGQTKLQSIEFPYGVKAVNFVVASGCESLEYVTLPETATSIDTQAFRSVKI